MTSTIDDAAFDYSGSWSHADDGNANLIDGTQSWTNDPTASFSFEFSGTGFDFCAGLKADRGAFTYEIDGSSRGAGTQLGDSMQADPVCQTVASVRNLAAGNHRVVFTNGGNSYFAADAVHIVGGGVANVAPTVTTTSSSPSSSAAAPSPTSSTSTPATSTTPESTTSTTSSSTALFSLELSSSLPSSISSSSIASSASAAPAAAQEAQTGMSSGRKAALVGGPIIAGIALVVIACLIYFRCKRRREADSVAIAPSASSHYLDEKEDCKGFFGPTDRSFSPIHFAGRISPISFGKRGHNRLNSEMSLESHTEPFRPTSLAQPPHVEPFHLPAGEFASYRSSHLNPTSPPAAIQRERQSSYEDRLAAASASLPDWRASTSDVSRYPSTVYQRREPEPDRMSTYSALYEGLMDETASSHEHDDGATNGRDRYRST